MRQAKPLDTKAIEVLWPKRRLPPLAPRPSFVTSASTLVGQWEHAFNYVPATVGPFRGRYFILKIERNANFKLKGSGTFASESGDGRAMAVKYEQALTDAWAVEGQAAASDENYRKIGSHLARGDWAAAAAQVFSIRLKGQLGKVLNVEFDVSADSDLCIFGATAKVTVPVSLSETRMAVDKSVKADAEFEGGVTFRVGLTFRAWAQIARAIGGPTLQSAVMQLRSMAARRALMASLSTGGAFAIGAAAGVGLTYVTCALLAHYKSRGIRAGVLTKYCSGYLAALVYEDKKSAMRAGFTMNKGFSDGFGDCGRAVGATSRELVQKTLIKHFGSEWTGLWGVWGDQHVSQVGDSVNTMDEVISMSVTMADYLAENVDTVLPLLSASGTGSFLSRADAASR